MKETAHVDAVGNNAFDVIERPRDDCLAPGVVIVRGRRADAVLANQQGPARKLGVQAFEAVGGRGLARVDFFLAADGLYVNELNTMPGFTPISMFPKCWLASGMTYPELISELVDTALERASLERVA